MHLLILLMLTLINAHPSNATMIARLQPKADAVLKLNDAQARPHVGVVFDLADHLSNAGRLDEADHYYQAGLRIQPHDFDHHLFYAQLLAKLNRPDAKSAQAQIVLQGSENQALVAQAQELLGKPLPQIEPLDDLPTAMPILVLVPLGDIDLLLLQDEQAKLHDTLHIDVRIRSVPFKMPLPDRRPLARTPQNRQWSARYMISLFAQAVHPFTADNVRFIGVTCNDIYADDKNYYFAWSDGDCSIVSYARFLATFNNEMPDRARLARRFHFQCLTSAGHVFGLDRCMDSSCPLGYPMSVKDQDAKSDKLCDTCQKGFDDAFGQYDAAAQTKSTMVLLGLVIVTGVALAAISMISANPLPLTGLIAGVALLVYTAIGVGIQRVGNGPMYPAFGRIYLYVAATCGVGVYAAGTLRLYWQKKNMAHTLTAAASQNIQGTTSATIG
jgi:predicted Zn-dependent protease